MKWYTTVDNTQLNPQHIVTTRESRDGKEIYATDVNGTVHAIRKEEYTRTSS